MQVFIFPLLERHGRSPSTDEQALVLLKIAAFVVPLGLDTLAVAVALGLRGTRPLGPALIFACFEAFMPLLGLFLGRVAGERFETPAALLGGVILLAVAAYMLKEALENDEADSLSFASPRAAVLAGFGISIDELAIGFPMGTSGLPIAQTIGAIAIQTLVVTCVGIFAGNRLGVTLGGRASRIAGIAAAAAFALLGTYIIAARFVPAFPEL